VANTQYGKVRGFVSGDVLTFKGVPYGQNTTGENRWLPAKPPMPWKDEYPALIYGGNCPQYLHDNSDLWQAFLQDWDDGYQSEDMLKLTSGPRASRANARSCSTSMAGDSSSGRHMNFLRTKARRWRGTTTSFRCRSNHRLGLLGFMDVSEVGGPAYQGSINVGMDRSGCRAQVGAGEHLELRRRSGQGDDLWPVGRRRQGSDVDGMPSAKGFSIVLRFNRAAEAPVLQRKGGSLPE